MDNVKRALPRVSGSYFIDMWIDRLRLILRPGAAHRPCCILLTEAAFGGVGGGALYGPGVPASLVERNNSLTPFNTTAVRGRKSLRV